MSPKIFPLFKILNPPLFSSPFDKGGSRGILNRGIFDLFLFYLQEKIYRKTYKVKRE
jgi:hypothetical protein